MLFDLKGKRRRVVQVVYLTLAVLMGGGLVLFGIGGDVSGGLFDAFSDRGGNSSDPGNKVVEERLEKAEKQVQANPKNEAALKVVVRSNYQLATADSDDQTGEFGEEGKKRLNAASEAWKRYVALEPKQPDASLAALMVQAYIGLQQAAQAAQAAQILAAEREQPQSYIQLVQLWTQAGKTREADLAGKKAVSLAKSDDERKAIADAVKQAKVPPTQGGSAADQAADPGGVPAQ